MITKSTPEATPKGLAVIAILDKLREQGIDHSYLRNHEELPDDIGHDVDLLIDSDRMACGIRLIKEIASKRGWLPIKTSQFSSTALYFSKKGESDILHVDVFGCLEWRFFRIANSRHILDHSVLGPYVLTPDPADEIYLNVMTRLLHQGIIRDKHAKQATAHILKYGRNHLLAAFKNHLGNCGNILMRILERSSWTATHQAKMMARVFVAWNCMFKAPHSLLFSFWRYLTRNLKKLINPPGDYMMILSGPENSFDPTSTELAAWCSEWNAGRTPKVLAHRLTGIRSWVNWLFKIYPSIVRGHVVIANAEIKQFQEFKPSPVKQAWLLPIRSCSQPAIIVLLDGMNQKDSGRLDTYQPQGSELRTGEPPMIHIMRQDSHAETLRLIKAAIITVLINHKTIALDEED